MNNPKRVFSFKPTAIAKEIQVQTGRVTYYHLKATQICDCFTKRIRFRVDLNLFPLLSSWVQASMVHLINTFITENGKQECTI